VAKFTRRNKPATEETEEAAAEMEDKNP